MKHRDLISVSVLAGAIGGFLAGCYQPRRVDPPGPEPLQYPLEAMAEQFCYDVAAGLATECDVTSDKAGDYESWQEAFDDWTARNTASRVKAWQPVKGPLNEATGGDNEKYDAELLRKAAGELAKGYRRVKAK